MFESMLHRRRTPARRRLAALILSTGQLGVLGTGAVLLEPALPEIIEEGEPAVLVEWIAEASGGAGGGGVVAPRLPRVMKPPPSLPRVPPVLPSTPEVAPETPSDAVPETTPVETPSVPQDTAGSGSTGPVDLGLGGPGSGPGAPGVCPPGQDCSGGPACPPGETCEAGPTAPVPVEALRVKRRVMPSFPDAARSMGLSEGRCVLDITVDPKGRVSDVQIAGCPSVFHPSALEAAWSWRFYPYRVDRQPRSARFQLVVNFRGE